MWSTHTYIQRSEFQRYDVDHDVVDVEFSFSLYTDIHIYIHTHTGKSSNVQFTITSVKGHLYYREFPSQYQDRTATDPRTLFDAETLSIPTSPALVGLLQHLGTGIDHLVLWLDCDPEGENICFEVIRVVKPKMIRKDGLTNVWRAKFSSVTPKDINQAMKSLGCPNQNMSNAVDARQELDLKIGVAWTRFQTQFFKVKFGSRARLVSYGPCQTPTLGFVVARHDAIRRFTPETYYRIEATIQLLPSSSTSSSSSSSLLPIILRLRWIRNRLFDKDVSAALFKTVQENRKNVIVLSNISKDGFKNPPLPLNTVAMLKLASRVLGISPKDTMRVAEDLYLRGLISYPRTETSKYPRHFDIKACIREQTSHETYGDYATKLLNSSHVAKSNRGVDCGDHPPITPTSSSSSHLRSQERRLYDMIVRHFLASVSPSCVYAQSIAKFRCAREEFEAKGLRVIEPGFTEILPKSCPASTPSIPSYLNKGTKLEMQNLDLISENTTPPSHLAEHELVSLMERHGVGTDASMATHIGNIQTRNYVTLGPGRTLVPTEMGLTLVHGYLRIDPELVLPKVRASIEAECSRISRGEAKVQDVVEYALDVFRRKYDYFVSNVGKMDELFSLHFAAAGTTGEDNDDWETSSLSAASQNFMSRCGACQTYMNYVSLPPHRLFCKTCDTSYNLPSGAAVTPCSGQYCPLDHFELVCAGKAKVKMCPRCFNDPPFEDALIPSKRGGMTCNACPHPTCNHSFLRRVVCVCPTAKRSGNPRPCRGSLVLKWITGSERKNRRSKATRWQLSCNGCELKILIHRVRNVVVKPDRRCKTCDAALLSVEFDKKKGKQKPELYRALLERGGKEKWWKLCACVVCDDVLNAQTSASYR